jgi:hypothetical protein
MKHLKPAAHAAPTAAFAAIAVREESRREEAGSCSDMSVT